MFAKFAYINLSGTIANGLETLNALGVHEHGNGVFLKTKTSYPTQFGQQHGSIVLPKCINIFSNKIK